MGRTLSPQTQADVTMMWPEPEGFDEEFDEPYVPYSQRRPFRIAAWTITVIVVLAMVALTLGPYFSRSRVARVPVTTVPIARPI